MHYELPCGRVVVRWGRAVDALLDGAASVLERETGRTWTRKDALFCLGYDGAARRGMLDEYKRMMGIPA